MILEREKIDEKFKWQLSELFATDDEWEELFFKCEERLPHIAEYQGKLADSDKLFECLEFSLRLSHDIGKLYQYAKLHFDLDTREGKYQGMINRAEMLIVRYSSLASFIDPEVSRLPIEELEKLSKSKKLADWDVYFKNIIRNKDIILSEKEEKILGEVGLFAGTNDDVFTMFDNADVKFAPVKDDKGVKHEMSHGTYAVLSQNPSQSVRKKAFESMFTAYKEHINMLAANYAGNVKKDWFFAKVRRFNSSLEYAMYQENVPPTCYKKLLEAVGEGLKPLHRYIALRKKALGVKTLNMYDLYVPIVPEQELSMPYEEAVELVKKALAVMGEEYSEVLASAFENHWIDVYETKGKQSGAYSWGVFGAHPFVLLNYVPTVHDVFTIAHELGHSMHSYYSNLTQPEQKAGYEIFCAEIASTVNEVLLLKYLLKSATGEFKKYLLTYYLDMFRMTLFRQTQFGEFEAAAHELVEKGEPITAESLSNIYYELNKKYYGKSIKHNDLIRYEWARIPHFYNSFYVYKYATGITTAVSIANNLLEQGAPYFAKYKKFLSAGGSMPPLDIIRLADVDLESDKPYKLAMKEFADTLAQLEEMYKA